MAIIANKFKDVKHGGIGVTKSDSQKWSHFTNAPIGTGKERGISHFRTGKDFAEKHGADGNATTGQASEEHSIGI